MRILRFDEEVAFASGESGVRASPLTGPAELSRLEILYVPAGSELRRSVRGRLLCAVVSGEGRLGDARAPAQPVAAGKGALWEDGEEAVIGTASGMGALWLQGEFEVWASWVTQEITVADYDPRWPSDFESLCGRIWPAIFDLARRIDHVGSTAVPGLCAKPIIDMDIVVSDASVIGPVIERLESTGYRWRGDLGVKGREAFGPPADRDLPAHHLYLVVEDNKAHLDHWLLRDLLRADPAAARRYGELKRRNAESAGGDIDVYVAAKAAFVADLLTRARAERGLAPATYWEPETPG